MLVHHVHWCSQKGPEKEASFNFRLLKNKNQIEETYVTEYGTATLHDFLMKAKIQKELYALKIIQTNISWNLGAISKGDFGGLMVR